VVTVLGSRQPRSQDRRCRLDFLNPGVEFGLYSHNKVWRWVFQTGELGLEKLDNQCFVVGYRSLRSFGDVRGTKCRG